MQLLHTVTLVFCISSVLSLNNDVSQSSETTPNEIDNSAISRESDGSNTYGLKTYGGSEPYIGTDQVQNNDVPSTISPQPENPQPMPTTGCFGHLPDDNAENIPLPPKELSDPQNPGFVPQQFPPQNPGYGPQQFNPQNQGYGPQTQQFYPHPHRFYPHHYPHHHHPHFPNNPQNSWPSWRRNMQFVGPQQFYPQNPWSMGPSPWRRPMPFVMPPTGPQFGPQNGANRPPLVIVKLLQPIILPVAKPFYPEGGDRDPDSEDVDSKFVNGGGFQKYLSGRPHRMGPRRFGGDRMRSYEDRSNDMNSYGPYKINGENLHVSIKLH